MLEKQGRRTPLRELPPLDEGLQDVWEAFHVLSNSRPTGWSVGAIPVSEIVAVLDLFVVTDVDERLEWFGLLKAMDAAFLKHVREASSKEEPKEKLSGGRSTPSSRNRPYWGSPRRGRR